MTIEARLFLGAACAALLVYCLTPVAIKVAGRLEFYDKPAGHKGHARPTPYLGGAAVMAGFLLALCAVSAAVDARQSLAIAGGVAVLWTVGTLDDRLDLSAGLRAGIEVAIAAALWAFGLGWELGFGPVVDLVFTVAWILAVVNAINLFDNMDGQSSTMALIVASAVAVLGVVEGNVWLAATAAALAGSCLGFLPHNISSPARIFLGDGGSMPLGFAVAALVMIGANDAAPAWQALMVGLLLVGVPALDTTLVVVSRRRRGVSVLTGGRDHLTHRTRSLVHTTRLVATVLGGAQALIAALALFSVHEGLGFVLAAVLVYVVIAGATIAVLEARETRTTTPDGRAAGATAARTGAGSSASLAPVPANIALVVFGLGAGLSPFWFGFYDSKLWAPIGLGLVVACAAALLARPLRTSTAGRVLLVGMATLAVWTLASSRWGESVQQAVYEGNRALVSVAALAFVMVLARTSARATWLVGGMLTGTTIVALYVLIRMLGDDGGLFIGARLNLPMGYINAEATIFLMGLWMAVALAERREALVAGAGAALGVVFAGLVLLSLSRGAAGTGLAAAVVVLLLVPGRLRRIAVLAVIGLALAAASNALLGISETRASIPDGVIREAAVTLILAAGLGGVGWGLLAGAGRWVEGRGPEQWTAARAGAITAVVIGIAIGVVGLALNAGRIERAVERQYDSFVNLTPRPAAPQGGSGSSRLVSGSGNRYDYWRVAWREFEANPLLGVGAGNFDVAWFRERSVPEEIRQPHSVEIQVLSETGLVGGALLLIVVGATGVAFLAAGRRARTSPAERMLAVAAVGGATSWFVHTSADWMHLMPGVTAIALGLVAVAARRPDSAEDAPAGGRVGRVAIPVAVTLVLVLAGASLARQLLAERERNSAQAALAASPGIALRDANRSLRLDGNDVRTLYVKAAALARFNRGAEAEATLERAIAKEPGDFVSWALLGDLRTRRGDLEGASTAYDRAAELNPLETDLAGLAKDPLGDGG